MVAYYNIELTNLLFYEMYSFFDQSFGPVWMVYILLKITTQKLDV